MENVLVCLPPDERRAAAILAEAVRVAEELKAPLTIVHLYPAAWKGPVRPHPSAWHLKTDEPEAAVGRFAARHRFTRIVC